MKINNLLLRLTREKYINRWVIFLADLFLSVFSSITSLALISYILDHDYSNLAIFKVFLVSSFCSIISFIKGSSVTPLLSRPDASLWPPP